MRDDKLGGFGDPWREDDGRSADLLNRLDRDIIRTLVEERAAAQEKFTRWCATRDFRDPFVAMLHEQYAADDRNERLEASRQAVGTILRCARRLGLRFISVAPGELVSFEGVMHPKHPERHGWPVAWHLCRVLGIAWGAGNSEQHQVALSLLLCAEDLGTYDLRDPVPARVGETAVSGACRTSRRCADGESVAHYLAACRVAPLPTPVPCPWLVRKSDPRRAPPFPR